MSEKVTCPLCKKEVNTLYNNPMTAIDIKTGNIVKDLMCGDCFDATLEVLSDEGDDGERVSEGD